MISKTIITTHPLEQRVRAVGRRARRQRQVGGAAWFLAAVISATIGLALLDYMLRIQDLGVRLIALTAWFGCAVWAFRRFLYPVLARHERLVDVALRIERHYPQLTDRLSSALEFLGEREDDPTAGSPALRRAVVAETEALAEDLDLSACLDPRRLRRATTVLVAVLAAGAAFGIADPAAATLATRRLLLPWQAPAWPRWNDLQFEDAPSRLAKGEDFEVSLIDRNQRLPDSAYLELRFDDEGDDEVDQRPMRARGGKLVYRRENVARGFSYRAVGGDDDTPWIRLRVEQPPELASLQIRLIPPEYTALPPEKSDRHIRSLVGTRVHVKGRATLPLDKAELIFESSGGDQQHFPLQLAADGRTFSWKDGEGTWTIDESGSYWLRLVGNDGLEGGLRQRWEVRAVADASPTVSIDSPAANSSVTALATVPIKALVKDDLAIQSITLRFTRSDRSERGEQSIELFRVSQPGMTNGDSTAASLERGDSHTVQHDWNLTALGGLTPGDVLEFFLEAEDFKPQAGQSGIRRLMIISPEQWEDQLAQRQAGILGQLAEVLRQQRGVRSQTTSLQIQLREAGRLEKRDVDQLQSAELNQRQVARLLDDSSDGVAGRIAALLLELSSNRVDNPQLLQRLEELQQTVASIRQQQLPSVERNLIQALKSAREALRQRPDTIGGAPRTDPEAAAAIRAALDPAGAGQDEIVRQLEELLGELTQWDNYRRFARDIGRLRAAQEELQKATSELRLQTLTKQLSDLTADERAGLRRLGERQMELARRFEQIQNRMQLAEQELRESEPAAAQTLADALQTARSEAISGQMRESGRGIDQNQVGQAVTLQSEVLDSLRTLLDVLANRREYELARAAEQLGEAAALLDDVYERQQQLAARAQTAAAAEDSTARQQELRQLAEQQRQIAEQTERLRRQLDRLQASDAARTAGDAQQQMSQAAKSADEQQAEAAAEGAQQAQQRLAEAREQLEDAKRQVESDIVESQLSRLGHELAGLLLRQEGLAGEVVQLEQSRGSDARPRPTSERAALTDIADSQRMLAADTSLLADKMPEMSAFRIGLQGAASYMSQAASRLRRFETGGETQQEQAAAAARLEQLLEALRQDPPATAQETPPPEESSGGEPLSPEEQARARQKLAELKLLKSMQEDLNRRTRQLQQSTGGETPDQVQQQLSRLAVEQGRLADLLMQLVQTSDEGNGTDREPQSESIPPSGSSNTLDDLLLPASPETR